MTAPPEPTFALSPIGVVRSARTELLDDDWDSVPARIEIAGTFPEECLDGIEAFSHAEVLFLFHRVAEAAVERGARHPRGNPAWPRVGIFAQRGKDRPNRLGSAEYLPRGEVRQPAWSHEVMRDYWRSVGPRA